MALTEIHGYNFIHNNKYDGQFQSLGDIISSTFYISIADLGNNDFSSCFSRSMKLLEVK